MFESVKDWLRAELVLFSGHAKPLSEEKAKKTKHLFAKTRLAQDVADYILEEDIIGNLEDLCGGNDGRKISPGVAPNVMRMYFYQSPLNNACIIFFLRGSSPSMRRIFMCL